jgi:hypothetical protein
MDDLNLQLFRLRARIIILERMFLKLYAHYGVLSGNAQTIPDSAALIAEEVDRVVVKMAKTALSARTAPEGTTDAERALYADEFHGICEELKSYLTSLGA